MRNEKTMSMRDRIRKRAQERERIGGLSTLELPEGVDLFKPEKGPVEFDIIPYRVSVDTHPEVKKGEIWYERTYLAHRNVGPEEAFIVCPRTIGKKCPICEEHQRLRRDPDAVDEVVDALRAKERELFNVVLKDGDGEVMVLDISTYLFGRLLEEEIREGDESNAAFAELKGGKTLKVRWEQKSMGKQKFVEAGRIDFLDRDDIDEAALDAAVDLDKALKILSYEEIEKMFQAGDDEPAEASASGKEDDSDDGEEEEERPRRTIGRGATKGKPSVEKDPEEDDSRNEGMSDKDDEEDELPGLGKKKSAKKTKGEPCISCEGSGKTTKGKTCPICDGTGIDPDSTDKDDADDDDDEDDGDDKSAEAKDHEEDDDEDDEEDDEPEKKPARRSIRR